MSPNEPQFTYYGNRRTGRTYMTDSRPVVDDISQMYVYPYLAEQVEIDRVRRDREDSYRRETKRKNRRAKKVQGRKWPRGK